MTFDYARMKATADRLIAKFGQAATLRRPTWTGTEQNPVAGTPTDYPVTVVVEVYAFSQIDGERVRRDDLKVLVARGALTVEPAVSDKIVIGGAEHAIVSVRPTNPGGTVVMHELQARR